MKRALAGLVVAAAVLALVIPFVTFGAAELGDAALAAVRRSTGVNFRAVNGRLGLVHGLELEGVEANAGFPGGRYTIRIERMRLHPEWLSLLSSEPTIKRVVLIEPRLELLLGLETRTPDVSRSTQRAGARPQGRRETRAAPTPSSRWSLVVSDVGLRQASARLQVGDGEPVSLHEVDVDFHRPKLIDGALTLFHALTATGRVRIGEIVYGDTTIHDARSTFEAEGGELELEGASFRWEKSDFATRAHLNFKSIPFRYRLTDTAAQLDVEGIQATLSEFDGSGFGLDLENLKGEGILSFAEPSAFLETLGVELAPGGCARASSAAHLVNGGLSISEIRTECGTIQTSFAGRLGPARAVELVVGSDENVYTVSGTWDEPVLSTAAGSFEAERRDLLGQEPENE